MKKELIHLSNLLKGEVKTDTLHQNLYATDASVYREKPLGVAFPKNKNDVEKIIAFANKQGISIIPRAAGTSLAGQVVGDGLVVDCSKYMNQILEVNQNEKWVRVQPGVILDELNQHLEPYDLFFGPETSTSTHCTVGGMYGNNSCGTHSIIYGSVRQHILETEACLANGDLVHFGATTKEAFLQEEGNKGKIQRELHQLLKHPNVIQKIKDGFPPENVVRRNTGYALDFLINSSVFAETNKQINLCELLAGSEGTLAFTTEMKLNLVDLPPAHKAVVCVQHNSLAQACEGNLIAIDCQPDAVELMDDIIIDLARQNPIQEEQSRFIKGLPKAVLLVEFTAHSRDALDTKIQGFLQKIEKSEISHYETVLYDEEVAKVWKLRKAGLGVLGNLVGDKKPVALVEDTAVAPEVLPIYVAEFEQLMNEYGNECVFYAHISVGELHLRPILNLKVEEDRILFRKIGQKSAELVAKYNGSISGEHGDGRLRGEFIPIQYGEGIYSLFQKVKSIFDPNGIFNPGKIVDTAPMDEFLRYENNQVTKEYETMFDFSSDLGILRAAEKCNGMGFCRKSEQIGGTMCPSFQATKDEKDSTRARANTLREFLTNPSLENAFASDEIYEALDLCLSCKACKTECPSGVDMAKLKAEATYQRNKTKGIPFRSKLIATNVEQIKPFQKLAPILNPIMQLGVVKQGLGFATKRSMPPIQAISLTNWFKRRPKKQGKTVYLLADEFTDTYDVSIGKKTIEVLEHLGYKVELVSGLNSGRSYISKGLLDQARQHAKKNIEHLATILKDDDVLIGIEPSSILTFRDETIDLLRGELQEKAKKIAKQCLTIEEFFEFEIKQNQISQNSFKPMPKQIFLHGHCQQKAMIGNDPIVSTLKLIPDTSIQVIPSGCCGMAGSFGYEKEHYELSMKIGELVLFPIIRTLTENDIIAAPGTSCRHQIKDGTNAKAYHPIEILHMALL